MNKRTIRFSFLFFVMAISFSALSLGQDKSLRQQDGSDWIAGINDEFKRFYLHGVIGGVIMGTIIANQEAEGGLSIAITFLEKANANMFSISSVKETKERLANLQMTGIKIGQQFDGIGILYSDFANRRIKIIDAIFVVKMQIDGQDPDLIQAQIRYLRMLAISQEEFNRISTKMIDETETLTEEEGIKMGTFEGHRLFRYGVY